MKTKRTIITVAIIILIVLLSSCDIIGVFIKARTRPIPVIQIYNSNLEKTLKMVPNDTLYVEVNGLAPETEYTVQCLDPTDVVITEMITTSDGDGRIGISPLWYDVGFKQKADGTIGLPDTDIALSAFHIRVFDGVDEQESRAPDAFGARTASRASTGDTDFMLPFFFVTTDEDVERPQPIVIAGKVLDETSGAFEMDNVFYSDRVADPSTIDRDGGSTDYSNKLFVDVEQFTPLIDSVEGLAHKVRIWILPFSGDNYEPGTIITETALFYLEVGVEELQTALADGRGIHIPWPVDSPETIENVGAMDAADKQDLIPEWAEEQAFSVFLDMRDNDISGIYQVQKEGFSSFFLDSIDGNGVAGFIVRTPPNPPDVIEMQLASGGVYRYRRIPWYYSTYGYWSYRYTYDYDYRDYFRIDGRDTRYSSHSGAFWGYGVKVIWNPYIGYNYGQPVPTTGLYRGRYVDVYVVKAEDYSSFTTGQTITPAPGTYRSRVPVQYGCANGWYQQTIWRAPLIVGNYMIIVDMDMNGKIDDGDLVDNVRQDGLTNMGGFTVR